MNNEPTWSKKPITSPSFWRFQYKSPLKNVFILMKFNANIAVSSFIHGLMFLLREKHKMRKRHEFQWMLRKSNRYIFTLYDSEPHSRRWEFIYWLAILIEKFETVEFGIAISPIRKFTYRQSPQKRVFFNGYSSSIDHIMIIILWSS